MTLAFNEAWMLSAVLLWVRLGTLFFMSPLVSAMKAPATFVMLFTLVLSGLLAGAMPVQVGVALGNPIGLALAVLAEVITGALMGFAVQCGFAAFSMAGNLIDLQMGLGMGSVFNPVTRTNSPVMGSILALFSVAFFFAADGHHALMRGIAFSVSAVPPGTLWFVSSPAVVLRPFGAMFTTAIAVIAPALFLLMLVELVLMVAARVLPQMSVFFVAMPAKILIGLAALAMTASFIGPVMGASYVEIFRFWDGVLR
jgi:flagellar biosynthetic protein FliR